MKLDQLFVKAVVSEVRCLTVKSTFPTRPGKIKWGLEKIQQLATQPRKNERIFHIITQSKHLLSEPNANITHGTQLNIVQRMQVQFLLYVEND